MDQSTDATSSAVAQIVTLARALSAASEEMSATAPQMGAAAHSNAEHVTVMSQTAGHVVTRIGHVASDTVRQLSHGVQDESPLRHRCVITASGTADGVRLLHGRGRTAAETRAIVAGLPQVCSGVQATFRP